jgi:hypothetical protein
MTKSRQAKDFLVQQASEQAALEGVQLSDLEKRMMYFTESDSSCENPAALNEEFGAKYNPDEYETKVSDLRSQPKMAVTAAPSDALMVRGEC